MMQSFRVSPWSKKKTAVLAKSSVIRLLGKVLFWAPGGGRRRKSLMWDDSFRENVPFSFLSC